MYLRRVRLVPEESVMLVPSATRGLSSFTPPIQVSARLP